MLSNRNPFLNVDLEIEASTPIRLITEEFGEEVMVLYSGKTSAGFLASYEVDFLYSDADSVIRQFCSLIDSLSEDAMKEWNQCIRRTFDIGYGPLKVSETYSSRIRSETVALASRFNVEIVVTLSPRTEDAEPDIAPSTSITS